MHELSIAMSIVEMAGEEAERQGGYPQFTSSWVRYRGWSRKRCCPYEMTCEDTPLAGSRLIVEEVPIVVFCAQCQVRRGLTSAQWFCCPECGTPSSDIVQGKELEVVALEIQ